MKPVLSLVCLLFALFFNVAFAEPLSVGKDDTIQSILLSKQGKRLTVKLKSGSELTGKVGEVNAEVLHLMELSGKEYFDAVIATDKIEAVVVRTRSN